eukprot:2649478-Pyramimonas_sp.AAC.1
MIPNGRDYHLLKFDGRSWEPLGVVHAAEMARWDGRMAGTDGRDGLFADRPLSLEACDQRGGAARKGAWGGAGGGRADAVVPARRLHNAAGCVVYQLISELVLGRASVWCA